MQAKVVHSEGAPAAIGPYSQGLSLDHLIFLSGQIPVNPETGEMPEDIQEQTRQALKNVEALLQAAGANKNQVLKTTVFLKDLDHFAAMNEVYADFFKGCNLPARSCFQVAGLPKGAGVEIEVIAYKE